MYETSTLLMKILRHSHKVGELVGFLKASMAFIHDGVVKNNEKGPFCSEEDQALVQDTLYDP